MRLLDCVSIKHTRLSQRHRNDVTVGDLDRLAVYPRAGGIGLVATRLDDQIKTRAAVADLAA
jgi:hypothetical protein